MLHTKNIRVTKLQLLLHIIKGLGIKQKYWICNLGKIYGSGYEFCGECGEFSMATIPPKKKELYSSMSFHAPRYLINIVLYIDLLCSPVNSKEMASLVEAQQS